MLKKSGKESLDPWLNNIKRKISEAKEFLEGRYVSPGIVVKLLYDGVILTLQRMIIEHKGINVLEQLRKDKKLYFHTLINILRKDGIEIGNVTELDILRDLRNRVEHENYRPTEYDTKWSYQITCSFIDRHYPEVFRLLEEKEIVDTDEEKPFSVNEYFKKFKNMKNFVAGEGIREKSIDAWINERRKAKQYFRKLFHPENLDKMTKEDIRSFFYFRNNRAWTQLYRRGLQLIDNLDGLRRAIVHLQDESISIESRIRDVMSRGKYHLNGFGKNIATGILHICDDEDRYGVWNSRTESGLKILNRKPPISSDFGISYIRINNELLKLKEELDTDLVMIDSFMWYLSKMYS